MRPIRLLLTADAVGGVWSYARDLGEALRPHGVEAMLALLGPAPDAAQRAGAAAAELRLIETGLPLDWLAADADAVRAAGEAIARLAAREGADIVQLNQPALAAMAMPCPAIAAVHSCVATWWAATRDGPMPEAFAWQTALVRDGLSRAAAIVCPSRAFAGAVRAAYALPVPPLVVHNGRRPIAACARAVRDAAFTAGRLWDEGKDVATLDRAAARLAIPFDAAGPATSPAGDGVRLDRLRALGTLDEEALGRRLAARPVFASAARYEPFGLAVLEAAQAGCALVLSDIPTFRELWDGVARFVRPGDDAGFAAAIEALAADRPARLAAGEDARRRAARYTAEAMAAGMAAIYRRALSARAAA